MMSKTQSNNENVFQNTQPLSKNGDTTRKHQIKKQVFGEIKNVIHNHRIATPLKQDSVINNGPSSKNLPCTSIRNIQQINESKYINMHKTQKTNSLCNSILDENNYLDYFDFRGQCCSKPHKSDQQIWSEMNLYDDSFLNMIVDSGQLDKYEEPNCEVTTINDNESDPELFCELKHGFNHNYWPDKNDFKGESDIHLYLEKPLLLNDFQF
ncbi:uncharacterized protein LOC135952003 [Calliphora vicina]|uniref:uncharacterized protein LOC135952003 n=1 Tax=Calliphora vicina TaxID=7373 RepID=UPI00325BB02B